MTPRLTPREWQVARLVAERWSNAEIAERLGIAVNTVQTHIFTIATKLPADGRRARGRIAHFIDPANDQGGLSRSRASVPISVRFEIFRRDGFACRYCGRRSPDVVLHVDHAVSVADGGTNDPDNLVTACFDCNMGKGRVSVPPQCA